MPKAVREAVGAQLEDSAKTIVATQKNMAPVEDGGLKKSIKYSKGSVKFANSGMLGRQKGKPMSRDGDPDLSIWITAGDEKAFYARWVEFGTKPHAQPKFGPDHPGATAVPFFFPGYWLHRKSVKSKSTRAMKKAIKSVAGK